MFTIKGSRSVYNKAEIDRIIIDPSRNSVTISFFEGFDEDGSFVSVGMDHITLNLSSLVIIDNAISIESAEELVVTELNKIR